MTKHEKETRNLEKALEKSSALKDIDGALSLFINVLSSKNHLTADDLLWLLAKTSAGYACKTKITFKGNKRVEHIEDVFIERFISMFTLYELYDIRREEREKINNDKGIWQP